MSGLFFGLLLYGDVAQMARASALQAEGRGFKPLLLHMHGSPYTQDC